MCPHESFVRFSSCSPQRTNTRAQRGPGSSLLHEKSDSSLLPAHPMRMQAASDKHPSSADWLLVAIPGIIWGASFLFIAEGLRSTAPNGVSFIRIVIGFATLSLIPRGAQAHRQVGVAVDPCAEHSLVRLPVEHVPVPGS